MLQNYTPKIISPRNILSVVGCWGQTGFPSKSCITTKSVSTSIILRYKKT